MTCYEDLVFRGLIKDMTNNEDFIEKLLELIRQFIKDN